MINNEKYINEHFESFKEEQKQLLLLLRVTKNNTDKDVILLRKEIIKYIQTNENYVAQIELDNFQMGQFIIKLEDEYEKHKLQNMALQTLNKYYFNDRDNEFQIVLANKRLKRIKID